MSTEEYNELDFIKRGIRSLSNNQVTIMQMLDLIVKTQTEIIDLLGKIVMKNE